MSLVFLFYSLSYENLFDDIVENYSVINKELGDIQDFRIVKHEVLIGERIIDDDEEINNLITLKNEFVEEFDRTIRHTIDAKLDELRGAGTSYDKRVGVLNNAASLDLLMKDAQERFGHLINAFKYGATSAPLSSAARVISKP